MQSLRVFIVHGQLVQSLLQSKGCDQHASLLVSKMVRLIDSIYLNLGKKFHELFVLCMKLIVKLIFID